MFEPNINWLIKLKKIVKLTKKNFETTNWWLKVPFRRGWTKNDGIKYSYLLLFPQLKTLLLSSHVVLLIENNNEL